MLRDNLRINRYSFRVSPSGNVKDSNVVILFGFNRIEMLKDRLEELKQIAPKNLFVSIDFLDQETSAAMSKICRDFSVNWPEHSKFSFDVKSINLGLALHIVSTIDEILSTYESVVVVEDDISISDGFYHSALKALSRADFDDKYLTFGGFSPIALPKFLQKLNLVRSTPYFSSWGWAISREGWEGYKVDIIDEDIAKSLEHSRTWIKLSSRQKKTWIGRFRKIQKSPSHTWDTQFQYYLFKSGKTSIVPVGRLVENVGFDDPRSSHTKSARPKWMGRSSYSHSEASQSMVFNPISRLLVLLESLTVVGDIPLLPKIKKLFRLV